MKIAGFGLAGALVAASWSVGAFAQTGAMVRASDPESIRTTLEEAGYDAELTTDDIGDPLIKLTLSGRNARIYFYHCDETTHDECGSLQFSAGFDREKPWTASEAIKLSGDYRYMSVRLDEENDPYIHWDVEIGEGILRSVFLRTVLRFTESVETANDIVFADE